MKSDAIIKTGANKNHIPRRQFIKIAGTFAVSVGMVGCAANTDSDESDIVERANLSNVGGYILVDTKKCQGCMTCMMTCSLSHEGKSNLSLSRIQVTQNAFNGWPDDTSIEQCRQCVEPGCLESCPQDAIYEDTDNGNVKLVDETKCIGCMTCLSGCSFGLHRNQINPEKGKAQKCDLCLDTPYFSGEGGPDGQKACFSVCPVNAISFTSVEPNQEGEAGYKVNLRDRYWVNLGYPAD